MGRLQRISLIKELLRIESIIKEKWEPSSILHVESLVYTACVHGVANAEKEF